MQQPTSKKRPDLSHWAQMIRREPMPRQAAQSEHLMATQIVGSKFVEGFAEHAAGLRSGSPVSLVRERENTHDPHAVLVLNERGEKLGYIPRTIAPKVAAFLDSGQQDQLTGEISSIQAGERGRPDTLFISFNLEA